MIQKECRNCMFALDGKCTLENKQALKNPKCPYKEGTASSLSVS